MFRILLLCVAVMATMAMTWSCNAWGAQGHRLIGQIAWANLTPQAKAGVQALLGDESLGAAGCWADQIRSRHEYDWAKPMHYVNVPRDAQAVDTARDCVEGQCVVDAIRRFRAKALDSTVPREERAEALKFLIHFVGDVHQPLHVSYEDDRGGNKLVMTFMGRKTNFHAIWDSGLIDQRLGQQDWIVVGGEMASAITPEQSATIVAVTDPLAWANETLVITRRLYAELDSDELSEPYYTAHVALLEQQLQTAGLRLANMLNAMYNDQSEMTAVPASTTAPQSDAANERRDPAETQPTGD